MSEFDHIKVSVQQGIKSTEALLNFYKGIEKLLFSLENLKLKDLSINLTIDDLMTYFPNYDSKSIESIIRKQGVKKYQENSKTYYKLSEIVSCFNFIFLSNGVSK